MLCKVEGCTNEANRKGAMLCEKHYGRLRRRGTTDERQLKERLEHTGGYVLVYAPDHWLTKRHSGSYEYEHRIVFYDEHGQGPFSCHWCEAVVTWDDMHVDHLNDDKADNDPSNLVSSCPTCNQARGYEKMKAANRAKGRMLTLNGITLCVSEWAEQMGIGRSTLDMRLRSGWSIERALTADPREKRQ